MNRAHFIGIGGIGISALARWFLSKKWKISGSDLSPSPITEDLKKSRVKIYIGQHQASNLHRQTSLIIYNQAITRNNPELRKARKIGITIKSYPEAVGELTKVYKTFAVAGAHGKSTTTALLSLVLIEDGWNPTVIVGTKLPQFSLPGPGRAGRDGSNFRSGNSNFLVLEADEWKASFLNYYPWAAIVTNIDKEHLDFYKNLNEIKKTFLKFLNNIHKGGILVLNRDNKNLRSLKNEIEKIAQKNNLKIYWYTLQDKKAVQKIAAVIKIPGQHNISNALAVFTLATVLGIKEKNILLAIGKYSGAWRRMEYKGELKVKSKKLKVNAKVYDDYAHHPTEIKATLSAFREKFPKSKIVCVFQPHQAERLKLLFSEFTKAFKDADKVVILPTYEVAGREQRKNKISAEQLAKKIGAIYVADPKKNLGKALFLLITKPYTPNPVIIMMGAGNIIQYTNELLRI